ncbi:MAG: hypothetical protein ABIK15_16410 [Pseudomonadota bacterium]
MDKKKAILIALAALFVMTLVYRIMNPYRQKTVSSLTYTSGNLRTAGNKPVNGPDMSTDIHAVVMLDRLMNPEQQTVRVFRNIFDKKAPAGDARPSIPADTVPSRETPESVNTPIPKEPEQDRMIKDLSQLAVFGASESNGRKLIFLERGKDILIVRKGDIIDGQYRVENISDRSITFRSEIQGQSVTMDISDLFTIGF